MDAAPALLLSKKFALPGVTLIVAWSALLVSKKFVIAKLVLVVIVASPALLSWWNSIVPLLVMEASPPLLVPSKTRELPDKIWISALAALLPPVKMTCPGPKAPVKILTVSALLPF
jgi:hypothetical protein